VRNAVRTNLGEIAVPLLQDILSERAWEFAGEGFKIHEIKRLKQSFSDYTWDDERLVFPIPQIEIDATEGALVQNPGY
ncbi:MAG: RagB/SusD family nutrient uptake outer membrane protein, partial [Chitinophagaceae bacterium]|nr:RagB/SusD family nutrient uptake outer membrane protein [Chitinophagaceae bacterium]